MSIDAGRRAAEAQFRRRRGGRRAILRRMQAEQQALIDVQRYKVDRWFRSVRREFAQYVRGFRGQPCTYVEIGCWMGASAHWMLSRVLRHPKARAIGVDPYAPMLPRHPAARMDARHAYMMRRLSRYAKWTFHRTTSEQFLLSPQCPPVIDCLYIDGDHAAPLALADWVLAWRKLRVGSVVVLDDYGRGLRKSTPCVPAVVQAIDACYRGKVVRLHPFRKQAAYKVVAK